MYRRGVQFHIGRANSRDDLPGPIELIRLGKLTIGDVTARVVDFDHAADALQQQPVHKLVMRTTANVI